MNEQSMDLQIKPAAAMKKIEIRRTGDIRLTAAACACPYSVTV